MQAEYIFREIEKKEVPQMFALIRQRMKWMDEQGIRQWNAVNYDEIYPLEYYEQARQRGEVFVLVERAAGEVCCAAVLKEQDERWADPQPAIYVHNFVSAVGQSGLGAAFLRAAEDYAAQRGKAYLRLDSAEDNAALAQYYTAQGFEAVGYCTDGPYQGVLRQKALPGRCI